MSEPVVWSTDLAVSIIESDGKYYLLLVRENNSILAYPNVAEGVRTFEDAYNAKHDQSYEASMSAALHHIFYQPSVINVPTQQEVADAVFDGRATEIRSIAGAFIGALLKDEIGKQWWDKGIKPRLISR